MTTLEKTCLNCARYIPTPNSHNKAWCVEWGCIPCMKGTPSSLCPFVDDADGWKERGY